MYKMLWMKITPYAQLVMDWVQIRGERLFIGREQSVFSVDRPTLLEPTQLSSEPLFALPVDDKYETEETKNNLP